jgi:hypothetical protein
MLQSPWLSVVAPQDPIPLPDGSDRSVACTFDCVDVILKYTDRCEAVIFVPAFFSVVKDCNRCAVSKFFWHYLRPLPATWHNPKYAF